MCSSDLCGNTLGPAEHFPEGMRAGLLPQSGADISGSLKQADGTVHAEVLRDAVLRHTEGGKLLSGFQRLLPLLLLPDLAADPLPHTLREPFRHRNG